MESEIVIARLTETLKDLADAPVDVHRKNSLEKKLIGLTLKVEKLIDLLASNESGTAPAFKRAITQAELERANISRELEVLRSKEAERSMAQKISSEDAIEMVNVLFEELKNGVDLGSVETIKAALSGFIDKILLYPVT